MQNLNARRLSRLLCASVAFAALATDAGAQNATAGGAEEIVVTARRREETLKDVPVAVSAYSAQRLETLGATDITALQQTTPNLTLQVARGSNSTVISFIRGVGQQDPLWGFEPGVGLYVDDVYIARPQGAVLDIYDVERIEVLRGPQGTLYGRNTIGGAIKYVTKKIGADPEFTLKGTIGTYGEHNEFASFKGRIAPTLGVSFAVAKNDRDGYGSNLFSGAEHYNKDTVSGRAAVEWTPSDRLFFRVSADYLHDMSAPRHGHRETPALDILSRPIAGGEVLSDVYDTRSGIGDKNSVINQGISLLGEWQVTDRVTLKSITAYRSGHTEGPIDFDGLPGSYLDVLGKYNDHQFTQELQLLVNSDRWNGVAGLYYMNGTAAGAFDTIVSQLATTIATLGYVDTRSYAAFADFSYNLTEALSLDLGARYTQDKKTGSVYRQNYTGLISPYFGNRNAIPGLVRSNFTSSRNFSKFTPHASLSYKLNQDLTTYASYGRGFKSGGFDMRADQILTPDSSKGYAPEIVDTFEIGLKGYLLNRRLSFNAAAFYSKYKDQQVTLQTPVGASIASQVQNVGNSHIKGAELEAVGILTPELSVVGSLGYTKAVFDKYLSLDLTRTPPAIVDFSNARVFQNTPHWTNSFGLIWKSTLGDGSTVTIAPTASYRSRTYMFEIPSDLDQKSYWLYNATASWSSANERYKVSLNGLNLGDKRYRIGGYNFPQSAAIFYGNSVDAFYGPPRTVSLSLQVKF